MDVCLVGLRPLGSVSRALLFCWRMRSLAPTEVTVSVLYLTCGIPCGANVLAFSPELPTPLLGWALRSPSTPPPSPLGPDVSPLGPPSFSYDIAEFFFTVDSNFVPGSQEQLRLLAARLCQAQGWLVCMNRLI